MSNYSMMQTKKKYHLNRFDLNKLEQWYQSNLRKMPCVLFGARQVGKSTLAYQFALKTGRKIFHLNFWQDKQGKLKKIFTQGGSATEVIEELEFYFNTPIDQEKSIMILDEIQACPEAYSMCKSFKEDTDLPVIATGSYLKLYLEILATNEQSSFKNPVGCTYEIVVHPMTFSEYLLNRSELLYAKYCELDICSPVSTMLHENLLSCYYEYLFVGGMPEVVSSFLINRENKLIIAANSARAIQTNLLEGYRRDFLMFRQNKLVSKNVSEKLIYTFDGIAAQIQEVRVKSKGLVKFKFSSLGKNVNFKRISNIFEYLSHCGLIIRSHYIKKLSLPLFTSGEDKNCFKCFYADVGLLNAKLDLSYKAITEDSLNSYKGAIAENFVAQEIYSHQNRDLLSWHSEHYEIEFIHKNDDIFIPIEVKSGKNSTASKSLVSYVQKYSPNKAYKVAPRNFGQNSGFISIPIYLVEKIMPGGLYE